MKQLSILVWLLLFFNSFNLHGNPISDWLQNLANSGDSRLLPITIIGSLATILGLLTFKKGFEKTFLGNEGQHEQSHLCKQICSSAVTKISGILITTLGLALVGGGIVTILANKKILNSADNYFN